MAAEELAESGHSKELEIALKAARAAGDIIDSHARNGFDDWNKSDGSAVTDADIESQEAIVDVISSEFPADGLLGEEEDLEPDNEDRVWIIDPLDGTYNFEKDFPYFCTSIALEVQDEVEVAVVHIPESSLGKTFLAARDRGAYVLDSREDLEQAEKISVSEQESIPGSLFFLTTFEVYDDEFELEKQLFTELVEKGASQRQLGACAVEMCFLASGSVSFQVDPIAKRWDYAAGKLLVEEAGGEVRMRESRFPGSHEIVASNGNFQEELEELVGDRFL